MAQVNPSAPPAQGGSLSTKTKGGIGGLIFLALLLGIVFSIIIPNIREKKAEKARIEAEEKARRDSTKKANNVPPQKINQPRYTNKLFSFGEAREFAVYLRSGWKSYPKGGPVEITTPRGKLFLDEPGVDNYIGLQPDGIYIFRAKNEETTGVEIYNYFDSD